MYSDFKVKGHLAMVCANIMWGLMSPVVKLVLGAGVLSPLVMVDFRVFGGALLFWATSLLLPREHVPLPDILRLFGAGMLGVLLNQGCFILGVSLTSPGEASLITTTMPMWVMILAFLILHEPITLKKGGGILCGATGAVILVLGNGHVLGGGANPALGDFIVLMAQLSYALYLTLYRNFIRKYSLVTLMKWMFLAASVVSIPATLSTLLATDWQAVDMTGWLGIAFVVVAGTYLAYICIMIGQKNLRPTIVGMYNYIQPIVATGVGVWLGLDTFTPAKGLAVLLIFGGVFLVTTSRSATPKNDITTK